MQKSQTHKCNFKNITVKQMSNNDGENSQEHQWHKEIQVNRYQ